MLLQHFNQGVKDDMSQLKLKITDLKENTSNNSVLIKCQNTETKRCMNLRVSNPTSSNPTFNYADGYVVAAAVIDNRRVYSTVEFECQSVTVALASGEKVIVERGKGQ